LKRHASVSILGILSLMGCGYVLYFSKNLVALDTFDFWVGSVLIFFLAMVQSILYGWIFGIKIGHLEVHRGAHIRVPWFVQLMMKYVVPVYLLAIFIGFCVVNLPTHEPLAFKTAADLRTELQSETASDRLRSEFLDNEFELPEGARIQATDGGGEWAIHDQEGLVLFVVKPSGAELAVHEHKAGYVEKISKDPVALGSIVFIGAVLAFLLLMVHIAGRRWEAEGKFEGLDP
jgi:hypothetical protein